MQHQRKRKIKKMKIYIASEITPPQTILYGASETAAFVCIYNTHVAGTVPTGVARLGSQQWLALIAVLFAQLGNHTVQHMTVCHEDNRGDSKW